VTEFSTEGLKMLQVLALNPDKEPFLVHTEQEYYSTFAAYFVVVDSEKKAIVRVLKGSERGTSHKPAITAGFVGGASTTNFVGGAGVIGILGFVGGVAAVVAAISAVVKTVTILLRDLVDLSKAVKEFGEEFRPYYKQVHAWAKHQRWFD